MTIVLPSRSHRLRDVCAPLIALALVLFATAPARAADALRGKALYASTPGGISCANSSCHGPDPTQNQNKILNGANNPSLIQAAINNNTGGMGIYKTALTSTDIADIAAYLGNPSVTAAPKAALAPASLSFPSTAVGSTSTAQTLTLSNSGSATLTISSITLSSAEFVKTGGTCAAGGSVAVGASCTMLVAFRPQASGTRTGSVAVASNASNGTISASLSGSGTATALPGVSPTSLSYGSVAVGSTSPAQTVTVTNTGTASMTLGTISLSTPQFLITGGSCANGLVVAAGTGSCTVLVAFAPTAGGAVSGTLSIAENAAGSPLTVALAGTGTVPAAPVASLSPSALSYSQPVGVASAAQTVTLANTGTAALSISSISLGGAAAGDYAIAPGSTCTAGGSVAAGGSCSVQITFTPSATGTRSGSLSIVHNDVAHSPSTAALTGTGTTTATGALSVNKNALSFAAQSLGTSSSAQLVTVGNGGSAALTIGSIVLGGSNPGDYALGSGGCVAGQSLAVGASCTVSVTFTPTVSSGTRTASLAIDAGSAGAATVSLSGTAAAAAAPILSLSPASLDFGSVAAGTTSAAKTSTLANTGSAPLNLASLTLGSTLFGFSHNCPSSLAAGASCTLSLSFHPATTGAVTGSVAIVSNAASSPDALALAGNGVSASSAVLGWLTPTALSFPDVSIGTQSALQPLSLHNGGTGPATLQSFQFSGPAGSEFIVDPSSSCVAGNALAAGASCTLQIAFAPAAAGLRSASLAVTSDATPPPVVDVSGNGVSGGLPVLGLTPSAITLSSAPNQPLQPQTLVLRNDGAAPLQVSAMQADPNIVLLDSNATGGGSCSPPPFTLAPAGSCTVVVQPIGSSVNGAILITSNATSLPASVSVSGTAMTNVGAGGSAIGLLALLAAPLLRRRRRGA